MKDIIILEFLLEKIDDNFKIYEFEFIINKYPNDGIKFIN
jgi:hypothetical protein